MPSLYSWDGKLLIRGGEFAVDERCCCVQVDTNVEYCPCPDPDAEEIPHYCNQVWWCAKYNYGGDAYESLVDCQNEENSYGGIGLYSRADYPLGTCLSCEDIGKIDDGSYFKLTSKTNLPPCGDPQSYCDGTRADGQPWDGPDGPAPDNYCALTDDTGECVGDGYAQVFYGDPYSSYEECITGCDRCDESATIVLKVPSGQSIPTVVKIAGDCYFLPEVVTREATHEWAAVEATFSDCETCVKGNTCTEMVTKFNEEGATLDYFSVSLSNGGEPYCPSGVVPVCGGGAESGVEDTYVGILTWNPVSEQFEGDLLLTTEYYWPCPTFMFSESYILSGSVKPNCTVSHAMVKDGKMSDSISEGCTLDPGGSVNTSITDDGPSYKSFWLSYTHYTGRVCDTFYETQDCTEGAWGVGGHHYAFSASDMGLNRNQASGYPLYMEVHASQSIWSVTLGS